MRMLALTVLLMLSTPAWAQTPGTVNAKLQDGSGTKITSTDGALNVNCPSCSSGGGLTDTQLRNSPVAVSGTLGVTGTFWQVTQPVSGTFWQSTQPVSIASMPSTPVTGTFWQSTQPVSGTFWQSTQPVSIDQTGVNNDVQVTNPATNYALETGGNLATIVANTAVVYRSTPLPRPPCNLVRRTQCAP